MSEVLTAQHGSTRAVVSAPQPHVRGSWARKRPAAAGLSRISDLALLNNETPQVPSGNPFSTSPDLSAESYDDSKTDQSKRSRFDSGFSTLSDESDSQPSPSNFSSADSFLGSAESQASSSNFSRHHLFVNNCRIGDFRIIGAGRDCKSVHEETNQYFDAKILTDAEFATVTRLMARLEQAEMYYAGIDIEEMKEAILPRKTEIVEEVSGRAIMFTPTYKSTLHAYAQERGVEVTELELQPIFERIIKMLAFCHSIGIIVRDLKPRKLVFDFNGQIRLQHVRDCVVLDDPNNDTVYEKFGSPAYIQPEVLSANGAGYSGKAADMWSLGVLMYLLLLGRYPFFDKTPIGVLQRIMAARVSLPPCCQISKFARVLLYTLLRRCPERRPLADQLVHLPWGQAKTLPSRGNGERMLSRRIMDELMNFQSQDSAPASEGRPAVPLDSDRNSQSPPINTNLDHLRQIFQSARSLIQHRRAAEMRAQTAPAQVNPRRLLVNIE